MFITPQFLQKLPYVCFDIHLSYLYLDLFHVDHRAGGAHHGEVVRHQRDLAAVYLAEARDFAIRWRFVFYLRPIAAREAARFDKGILVEQIVDALARVEMALGLALGELLRPAHADRLSGSLLKLLD